MFGFQLSNIIPGFPRHSLYFVEPPFELQATQHCENGQVRTAGLKISSTESKPTLTPLIVIQLFSQTFMLMQIQMPVIFHSSIYKQQSVG